MFGFTVVGFLIFRETRIDRLISHFMLNPFTGTQDQWVAAVVMIGMVVLTSVPLVTALLIERFVRPRLEGTAAFLPLQTTMWSVYIIGVMTFVRSTNTDFIYFAF